MRIIVTGSTSFLGTACAAELAGRGHEVIRLRHSFEEEADKLPDSADVWLHFAWAGHGSAGRSDFGIQEFNVGMSLAALKKAKQIGCGRFVFAGSQAEYGHAQDGSLKREDGAAAPVSEYGKAKLNVYNKAVSFLAGSSLVKETAAVGAETLEDIHSTEDVKAMQYVHMRIFSVYGPGDHAGSLINTLIDGFGHDEEIKLGNCTQLWNYMYIKDAARAVAMLCEHAETGIYNVASEDTRSLREYVEEVQRLLGKKGRSGFGMRSDNAEGPADLSPDISRLKALGFKPEIDFAEGIHRILNE